jgi:diguanylate cyclase (GGDEF)-like protein/PAS domain S-box-containing protein
VLAQFLPIVVWEIDEDGVVRQSFGRALTRMGLSDGDLDGVNVDSWGEEGAARTRRALDGEPVGFESEGVFDGNPWAMRHLIAPRVDGGAIAISIDTTDRHLAQKALDASEGRFRSLADHAPVGIFLAATGRGNVYTNAELQRQMGVGVEDTLGFEWERAVHPDDLPRVKEAGRRMREEGLSFEMEYRITRPDGEERWLNVNVHRFHDDEGKVVGSLGTSVDVTDRRRAVDELIVREERFRTVAESAPIGIFLADLEGEVTYANAYLLDLVGSALDDGTQWPDLVHPDDLAAVMARDRAFREEDAPLDDVHRLIIDGEVIWIHTHATKIYDDDHHRLGAVGTVIDITQQHLADERRRESEEFTEAILETAAEGIITIDDRGTIMAFNAAAEQIFGWDSDEAIGQNLGLLLPEPHREVYAEHLRSWRDTGGSGLLSTPTRELHGLRRDGTTVPIEMSIAEVHWGGSTAFTGVVRDVSERKEFERELEHQATHDPLTSLPNRALLAAQLESALARAYRNERSVGVLFISLDRMKMVTDSLGHRAGDELRVAASHRLQGIVRPSDTVTRFGENEFVILAEDLDDISDAVGLAHRIIEAMDVPFDLSVDEAFITANVGIAFALDGLGTAESLISDADVAMFRAKEQEGSHVEIFDSEMRAWVNSRRKTENALRHGLAREEFELHYQPIIEIGSGDIKGFEALVRWDRPHLGLVPPGDFIPVAEESGLIVPMGEWILGEACRQAAKWQADLPERGLTVSVNLSARQLAQRDIAETVALALRDAEADPAGLVIELTETVLLDDVEQAARTLGALRDIGVLLSMDDFGTGYSSLTYLRRFPIDIVKVDRSFVNQLGTDSRDASIVEMVVTLAHGLELDVVAEGVETEEQLSALASMGCQYAQGFLFARPQPASNASSLLAVG